MLEHVQPKFAAVVFDPQGKIISWNGAMTQLSGIEKAQALGLPARSIFPQLPASDNFEEFAATLTAKYPSVCELGGGGEKNTNYQVSWSHLPDLGFLAVFRDLVTATVQDLALETANARFALLANTNSNLVWTCGPDGKRDFFSAKWLRFTGRSLEREIGDGWIESVDPNQAIALRSELANALNTTKNYRVQYLLKAADGRYHSILESAIAQFAGNGTFLGFIGYCAEGSQGKLTQTTLPAVDSIRLFQASATNAHSPIGMWKLNRDLVITHANKAACDQLGVSHHQLIGKSFMQTIGINRPTLFQEVLEGTGSVKLKNQQVSTSRKNDPIAFLDIDAWSLIEENHGEKNIIGIAMSTLEVTDRKRLEQQKEDFVASLVHDLKTPLIGADRTLQGLIDLAKRHDQQSQSEILNLLKSSNHQLLTMVQNLIEIYRYEEGKPRLMINSLDLANVSEKIVRELSILAQEKGVELKLDMPPRLPHVAGDIIAIRRVCQNLVDNAIKFTERGGTVQVTAEQIDDTVALRVIDTGRGIPQELQPVLFTKFGQDKLSKTRGIGSGLGLYLTKQIVEAHKGSLSFISKESQGTTFTVVLPVAESLEVMAKAGFDGAA